MGFRSGIFFWGHLYVIGDWVLFHWYTSPHTITHMVQLFFFISNGCKHAQTIGATKNMAHCFFINKFQKAFSFLEITSSLFQVTLISAGIHRWLPHPQMQRPSCLSPSLQGSSCLVSFTFSVNESFAHRGHKQRKSSLETLVNAVCVMWFTASAPIKISNL